MPGQRPTAILLMMLGGPDRLENVEPYLRSLRGGRPTPPELVEEIRERYRLTGGKSPALAITQELAGRLEQRLNGPGGEGYRVYVGCRHWHPFIRDAYAEVLEDRPERLLAICTAPQYSALSVAAYIRQVEEAREALGGSFPVGYVKSWHRTPSLIRAFADSVALGLARFPAALRPQVPILFTAHSLPARIVAEGDPYPEEVRGTVEAVRKQLGAAEVRFAYQSQGRTGEPWLGPTVEETLEALQREGHRRVLIAPIGFLSDHVEVLYDIDIEFKRLAASRGMRLERTPMLNAGRPLVEALVEVVEAHRPSSVS